MCARAHLYKYMDLSNESLKQSIFGDLPNEPYFKDIME